MEKSFRDRSLDSLERRIDEIDSQIADLAAYAFRVDTGSVGFRSNTFGKADTLSSLQVDLDAEAMIDQVVLVPTLWREPGGELLAEGFPLSLKIIAGTGESGKVVATRSREDEIWPRIAPLVIDFPPTPAKWVRIEATLLTPRISDGSYFLQLAEIMVFSGNDNVALNRKVHSGDIPTPGFFHGSLTDGFTPYLMDAAKGEQSQTRLIRVNPTNGIRYLTIDLGQTVPVSQVNFHIADTAQSIPTRHFGDYAVPRHVRVLGSLRPDFGEPVSLCEYQQVSVHSNGPIIMRRFPETVCRFIRIEIVDHRPIVSVEEKNPRIAFSEIEVISHGENLALGRQITHSSGLTASLRAMERITDGQNYYGTILPVREWMNQLARRHDLEKERPLVVAELNRRYARQKTNIQRLVRATALIFAIAVFAIMAERLHHHTTMARLRERFAADLHDELGASLHSIGLLSDLAEEAQDSPKELSSYLRHIRSVTERSGKAVRYMADVHKSRDLYSSLETEMPRTAERIVPQLEHDFAITGAKHLSLLTPRTHADLFLFYQECLMNICRHSGANRIRTRLTVSPGELHLTVSDNGKGLPEISGNDIPGSLSQDNPDYRQILEITIRGDEGMVSVGTYGVAEVALRALQNSKPHSTPDIILLDLQLPVMMGLEALPWIREYAPDTKIIILTQSDQEADVVQAISLGASGYLLKGSTVGQIKEGIRSVMGGHVLLDGGVAKYISDRITKSENPPGRNPLSDREMEILLLLGEGLQKKEIAARLDIGFATVATHIRHIYEKLRVENAPAAISKAYQSGLFPFPEKR
eukprot:g3670.t1